MNIYEYFFRQPRQRHRNVILNYEVEQSIYVRPKSGLELWLNGPNYERVFE